MWRLKIDSVVCVCVCVCLVVFVVIVTGPSSVIFVLPKEVRAPVSKVEEGEDDGKNDARHDVNALGTRGELPSKN